MCRLKHNPENCHVVRYRNKIRINSSLSHDINVNVTLVARPFLTLAERKLFRYINEPNEKIFSQITLYKNHLLLFVKNLEFRIPTRKYRYWKSTPAGNKNFWTREVSVSDMYSSRDKNLKQRLYRFQAENQLQQRDMDEKFQYCQCFHLFVREIVPV